MAKKTRINTAAKLSKKSKDQPKTYLVNIKCKLCFNVIQME